jgi:hypothetical protein
MTLSYALPFIISLNILMVLLGSFTSVLTGVVLVVVFNHVCYGNSSHVLLLMSARAGLVSVCNAVAYVRRAG